MALKDAFVNIASAQAGKIASGFVGGVVSGIFGSNRPKVGGKTGTGATESKFSTKMLMYPSNVAEDDMQGHYIMFSARVADPGKLAKEKEKAAFAALAPQVASGEIVAGLSGETKANLLSAARKPGKSLSAKRVASSRVASTISLYMPPMVQVAYANKYGEQEIGYLAAVGEAMIGKVGEFINETSLNQMTSVDGFMTIGKNILSKAGDVLKTTGSTALAGAREMGIKMVDGIAPGARALISLSAGRVKTPHMELMFEGVARRTFTYAFVFIPKSRQESETVKEIIDTFKKHMTPNFSGSEDSKAMGLADKYLGTDGNSEVTATQQFRSMNIPDTFQINYMYRTVENQYINKISECYLQQMDVQFGGDKFSAHDAADRPFTPGAPPSRITCNLTFQEINIIDRDMIEAGY